MRSTDTILLSLGFALLLGGCATLTRPPAESTAPASAADKVDVALQRAYDEALSSMRKGDTKRAKQQLQQLIAQHPSLAGAQTNLGILQLKENDLAAAEHAFRNAIKSNPKSAPAHNQLGVSLRMQGRFQEAEQAYREALEIEPTYLLAHRNLGILYDLYLAKPKQALEQYRICQKLTHTPNHEIDGWIADLERRIKASK
jgi:Tfp pilus assembly protein PilF